MFALFWFGSLHGVFALGGLFFWSVLLIDFIAFCTYLYHDRVQSGVVFLIVVSVLTTIFSDFSPLATARWIGHNYMWIVLGTVLWLLLGLFCSVLEWDRIGRLRAKLYMDIRRGWLKQRGCADQKLLDGEAPLPDDLAEKWQEYGDRCVDTNKPTGTLVRHRHYGQAEYIKDLAAEPRLRDNLNLVRDWVLAWPGYAAIYFYEDFLDDFLRSLILSFRRVYDNRMRRHYTTIRQDYRDLRQKPGPSLAAVDRQLD